jgi:hypothetical protein
MSSQALKKSEVPPTNERLIWSFESYRQYTVTVKNIEAEWFIFGHMTIADVSRLNRSI